MTRSPSPDDSFDDIYEPIITELIDARGDAPVRPGALIRPAGRLRRGAAGVALATSLVAGVREVFEPEADEVYEEIDNGIVGGPDEFVTLSYVPNDPHATFAVLRPWLAPKATA